MMTSSPYLKLHKQIAEYQCHLSCLINFGWSPKSGENLIITMIKKIILAANESEKYK